MLTIKTVDGLDLVLSTPPDSYIPLTSGNRAPVMLECRAIEDDTDLPSQQVTGSINWNDGSQPVTFTGNGTVAFSSAKPLSAGSYIIEIEARNYRAPVADTAKVTIGFTVYPDVKNAPPERVVYGPILPRDTGNPSAQQWAFSLSSDIQILESSVKMLLLTDLGERVMEPDYGTGIKRILFESNVSGIESAVQEEIIAAMQRWEPRVELRGLSVERTDDRAVIVTAIFVSKITQQPFNTVLNFER